ncbi:lysoplasmalogenase [Dyella flava]|uniref:Lysoplasmalogenase n=1 Tax=Dyella flava TaxID=1920170 RepID=A0ABS2K545_9GAMM|nr:lysoplasmalogenase [Dyella flava]MBM7126345.1 lysoplasmalogenase [Dyella flava]GLQ48851.1 membrane protein [Dyella flava]
MSVVSSTPASSAVTGLSVLILVAAVGAVVGSLATSGAADAWHWLHWLCKPLATVLVLVMAWRAARPVSLAYRRRIVAGLVFCLLGDVLLMLPRDLFVPGLVSFLLAHVLFIAAFSSDVRFAARGWPWLACLAYGAGMMFLLWPGVAAGLRIPVILYVFVLASMTGQALGRAFWLHAQRDSRAFSARYAAAGAVLFMASDSLLAWDRFHAALPWAALYILATYYAALWLIAASVDGGVADSKGGQG